MKTQIIIITATIAFAASLVAAPPVKKIKTTEPVQSHKLAAVTNASDLAGLQSAMWEYTVTNMAAVNLVRLQASSPKSNQFVRVTIELETSKAQYAQLLAKLDEQSDGVSTNTASVDLLLRYNRQYKRVANPANTNETILEMKVTPNGMVHFHDRN